MILKICFEAYGVSPEITNFKELCEKLEEILLNAKDRSYDEGHADGCLHID